jgi:hypothetical protein
VDWHKLTERLVGDAVRDGGKNFLLRLKRGDRDQTAQHAIALFIDEFLRELEDKNPLTSALPGYHDHLTRLVEIAAPEISGWLQPDTRDVDLRPVERMWHGLSLDPLPEGFSWALVAQNYARALRKFMKNDPAQRALLTVALQEKMAESIDRGGRSCPWI